LFFGGLATGTGITGPVVALDEFEVLVPVVELDEEDVLEPCVVDETDAVDEHVAAEELDVLVLCEVSDRELTEELVEV
jgi:hypothetical protein